MVSRQVGIAALLRAEKRFKRVKGYREIPKLIAALGRKILTERRLQLNIKGQESPSYFNKRKGQRQRQGKLIINTILPWQHAEY